MKKDSRQRDLKLKTKKSLKSYVLKRSGLKSFFKRLPLPCLPAGKVYGPYTFQVNIHFLKYKIWNY